MTRAYTIGAAGDPNAANRQGRTRIKSVAMQALYFAGLRRTTALEAASDLATSYLIKGNNESLHLVRQLAGDEIAELLQQLRLTTLKEHP